MLIGTKSFAGLPGCYGNHCNHGYKELCTNSTIRESILSSYLAQIFCVTTCINE